MPNAPEATVFLPPVLPDKYDIIPIHQSDLATYKFCRRRWNWSSPARQNLRRKITIYGVNPPLWFGTGIHYALQLHYDPILQRDPVETFKTWWTWQVEGGIVLEDELEQVLDVEPTLVPGQKFDTQHGPAYESMDRYEPDMYKVRGMRELLPEFFEDEWLELRDLGIGMMTFYKEYAEKNDNFDIIAAESSFSVPLGFESIDTREESPNYGKSLEVHARGKRDAIIQWHDTGLYGIMDHKTAGKMDDDYFKKLEKDPQCSTYLWASQEEAKIHDLPWKKIEYVLYNVLRKKYPQSPTPLQSGKPSVDRANEGTTAELFEQYVRDNNLTSWFESEKGEKAQGYYTWLLEQGDKNFIIREPVYRNVHEAYNTGEQIKMIAKEMLAADLPIYPNPTGDWLCTNCPFRAPCIAADDGSDYTAMLVDGYERNRDR